MNAKQLLGLRIRGLRKKQGLKQEGLASQANITAKYLSDIELGKENPTFDVLVRLAAALKIEPWELLNYGHELSKAKLKEQLISFAKTSSEEDLRLTVKFIKTISR
jgi:transcriptional regulator with XRE-family HTH domain